MGNVNMEASQINYRGGLTKMSVEEALKNTSGEAAAIAQLQTDVLNLNSNKANQITIAPFFSAETSYDPGDLVYYNGLSYRCVNAHEGEWDADDFAATTISNEFDSLKSGLSELGDTSLYSGTGYRINKVGKLYILTIDGATEAFNVPSAYIPNAIYRGFVADSNGDYVGRVTINAEGIVNFTPVSNTPKYGSIVYFV